MPSSLFDQFKVNWANSLPWGGGHTIHTDPTKRGWRIKGVGQALAVIGRTGIPGCLSIMPINNGYDVAIYDSLVPEEVFRRLRNSEQRIIADEYRQVPSCPGWALPFIQELESGKFNEF